MDEQRAEEMQFEKVERVSIEYSVAAYDITSRCCQVHLHKIRPACWSVTHDHSAPSTRYLSPVSGKQIVVANDRWGSEIL